MKESTKSNHESGIVSLLGVVWGVLILSRFSIVILVSGVAPLVAGCFSFFYRKTAPLVIARRATADVMLGQLS
jgi:hypothetical protein